MKPLACAALALFLISGAARAQAPPAPPTSPTPQEWVQLGTRVHGFFGGFIPAGIRIGLDARERLKAEPRGLAVTYWQGAKAPCPCIADGIMLGTQASPGQGTLTVMPEKAPPGLLAVIVLRNRKTGEALRYTVADEWLPKMLAWNQLAPEQRLAEAMQAEGLFGVEAEAGK